MLRGILILLFGIAATVVTIYYATQFGGYYVVAYGAIVAGIIDILRALKVKIKGPEVESPDPMICSISEARAFLDWAQQQRIQRYIVQGYTILASVYRRIEDFDSAAKCYISLIEIEPFPQRPLRSLARVYRESGREEAALVCEELADRPASWWKKNGARARSLFVTQPSPE